MPGGMVFAGFSLELAASLLHTLPWRRWAPWSWIMDTRFPAAGGLVARTETSESLHRVMPAQTGSTGWVWGEGLLFSRARGSDHDYWPACVCTCVWAAAVVKVKHETGPLSWMKPRLAERLRVLLRAQCMHGLQLLVYA